jgi:hypothetical protein
MSGNVISLAAEALVAVLLVITIGYCMILNSRLKRLRADESDLRATISELVTATEIAERAIGGLKAAALDCDKTLTNRMREAEHFSIEIAREIADGQKVLARIKQIATAVRKAQAPAPAQVVEQEARPAVETAVAVGESVVRNSFARLEEAVTAKTEDAGVTQVEEAIVIAVKDDVRAAPVGQSRAAGRIEELRVMAEQARERLKELRKASTEKAA